MGEARDSDQVLQITGIERKGGGGWGMGEGLEPRPWSNDVKLSIKP